MKNIKHILRKSDAMLKKRYAHTFPCAFMKIYKSIVYIKKDRFYHLLPSLSDEADV